MSGLPPWARWGIILALAVTCLYYVLANAVDVLMRRWSRRSGCPVCGAGAAVRGEQDAPAGAGAAREGGG